MARLPALALAALSLAACNPVPPLGDADKAKFVYELIENDKACDSYRQRLAVPGVNAAAIAAIYEEAKKSTCIKRDV